MVITLDSIMVSTLQSKYCDQAVRCYCTDDMVRIAMEIFDRFRTKDEIESKSKIDFNAKVKVSYIREILC